MPISETELLDRISDRVEVKSVDIASNLSEETLAFTATVYVDGEIVGAARNRGRGGMTLLEGFRDGRSDTVKRNIEKLRDFADTLPDVEYHFGPVEVTAEMIVDTLVEHADFMNTIKRHIRSGKIVFRTTDQEYGEFSYIGYNGDEAGAIDLVREKHDVDVMYNEA